MARTHKLQIASWSRIGFGAGVGGLVGLHLLQEPLDALDVFLREVEGEMQVGQAAELETFDEFMANEP